MKKNKRDPFSPLPDDCTVCEVSGVVLTDKNKAIDHCHVTGITRGALTKKINTAYAFLGDGRPGTREKILALLRYHDKYSDIKQIESQRKQRDQGFLVRAVRKTTGGPRVSPPPPDENSVEETIRLLNGGRYVFRDLE